MRRRKLTRILALLLKKMTEEKTAPQAMLHIFLETKDSVIRKNTFKKLRKLFSRLSFNDIYPALGPEKIEDRFKADFWEMVLKFGIDNSELCSIVRSSDLFFAKEAFDELLKRFRKRRISQDRMKSFLADIMIHRPEFAPDSWLLFKKLGPLSYEDILCIKNWNSENYQSDFYKPIRGEIEKTLNHLCKNHNKMLRRIRYVAQIIIRINKLKEKMGRE